MKERRAAIRKYIETRGEVTISELATAFSKWSEMTLRRDLASLAEDQLVILTRGGARAFPVRYGLSEDIYTEREMRNNPAKSEIAQKALAFVEAGKGIFLDSISVTIVTTSRVSTKVLVSSSVLKVTSPK